ncbi:MAG: hypothetical protein RsTaC01_0281 [Candidatus Paraimprobicoccus trichonymphae]|uniref:Uncharacterized protein n=1 Tax=Candidatus Paraimprobicoccus trichonymphae TaxID=3033793 RepID=A0AA48IHB0_9FIRM|nr:MAG: hypothetical protein RsTaC01_0281 [Candidatus Paraimprobicoccus trichonymphae]
MINVKVRAKEDLIKAKNKSKLIEICTGGQFVKLHPYEKISELFKDNGTLFLEKYNDPSANSYDKVKVEKDMIPEFDKKSDEIVYDKELYEISESSDQIKSHYDTLVQVFNDDLQLIENKNKETISIEEKSEGQKIDYGKIFSSFVKNKVKQSLKELWNPIGKIWNPIEKIGKGVKNFLKDSEKYNLDEDDDDNSSEGSDKSINYFDEEENTEDLFDNDEEKREPITKRRKEGSELTKEEKGKYAKKEGKYAKKEVFEGEEIQFDEAQRNFKGDKEYDLGKKITDIKILNKIVEEDTNNVDMTKVTNDLINKILDYNREIIRIVYKANPSYAKFLIKFDILPSKTKLIFSSSDKEKIKESKIKWIKDISEGLSKLAEKLHTKVQNLFKYYGDYEAFVKHIFGKTNFLPKTFPENLAQKYNSKKNKEEFNLEEMFRDFLNVKENNNLKLENLEKEKPDDVKKIKKRSDKLKSLEKFEQKKNILNTLYFLQKQYGKENEESIENKIKKIKAIYKISELSNLLNNVKKLFEYLKKDKDLTSKMAENKDYVKLKEYVEENDWENFTQKCGKWDPEHNKFVETINGKRKKISENKCIKYAQDKFDILIKRFKIDGADFFKFFGTFSGLIYFLCDLSPGLQAAIDESAKFDVKPDEEFDMEELFLVFFDCRDLSELEKNFLNDNNNIKMIKEASDDLCSDNKLAKLSKKMNVIRAIYFAKQLYSEAKEDLIDFNRKEFFEDLPNELMDFYESSANLNAKIDSAEKNMETLKKKFELVNKLKEVNYFNVQDHGKLDIIDDNFFDLFENFDPNLTLDQIKNSRKVVINMFVTTPIIQWKKDMSEKLGDFFNYLGIELGTLFEKYASYDTLANFLFEGVDIPLLIHSTEYVSQNENNNFNLESFIEYYLGNVELIKENQDKILDNSTKLSKNTENFKCKMNVLTSLDFLFKLYNESEIKIEENKLSKDIIKEYDPEKLGYGSNIYNEVVMLILRLYKDNSLKTRIENKKLRPPYDKLFSNLLGGAYFSPNKFFDIFKNLPKLNNYIQALFNEG